MPLDAREAARAVLEEVMAADPPPGADMSEFDKMLAGGNTRITFPFGKLTYNGGTRQMRIWAEILRGLAHEFDRLSRTTSSERRALTLEMQAWADEVADMEMPRMRIARLRPALVVVEGKKR